MEQKAVSEVGSICFSKVLPGKRWNVKLELNWQLSKKIYTFLKKVDFRVCWKAIWRQASCLKFDIMKSKMTKSIFNLRFSIILKWATSEQMYYILATRPIFLFWLCIETTTVARFSVISCSQKVLWIFMISNKEVISRIYKESLQLNKKVNNTIKKWPKTCHFTKVDIYK